MTAKSNDLIDSEVNDTFYRQSIYSKLQYKLKKHLFG